MSMPSVLEGRWWPVVAGWRVDILDAAQGLVQSWTHEDEDHPFADITYEFDGIGCLASASLPTTRPMNLPPYAASVLVWIYAEGEWHRLFEGLLERPLYKIAALSELNLTPLETLTMRGPYSGSVPPNIPGGRSTHNLAGINAPPDKARWEASNDSVITDAMRADPTASIGVDAWRRVILARPTDGAPVPLNRADLYDYQATGYTFPPYGTHARVDPGVGWVKLEYAIDRGPLVPQVLVDGGSATFRDIVQGNGPQLVNARTLTASLDEVTEEDLLWQGEEFSQEITAPSYACVLVYDLQSWYTGSALSSQNAENLKGANDNLSGARMILGARSAAFGPNHPFTVEARVAERAAERFLSGVQAGLVQGESTYEPLSAMLTMGLQPMDLGFPEASLTLDWVVWLSKLPWDEASVGASSDPDDGYSIIHPKDKPNTIQVLLSTDNTIEAFKLKKPLQPIDITIPTQLFTQNTGGRIAQQLEANWRNPFKPDDPPEDEEPPAWDGRWFLHVACGWGSFLDASAD